jgi:Hypothetical glycosyl hydrolase family 15
MPLSAVHRRLFVAIIGVILSSIVVVSLAASGGAPPANTALPRISGVPTVGSTLTVRNGSWSTSPGSFTYQWQDCNAQGASCTDISGATSSSHVMTSSDNLSSIRAVVTATNAGGSDSASGITGPAPVFFNRLTYQYTTSLTTSQEANRYQFLNLLSPDGTHVSGLLAANPNLKILPIIDSVGTNDGDSAGPNGTAAISCTTYSTLDANARAHPGDPVYDWFLYTSSGNVGNPSFRALYPGTTGQYLTDVGNPYYQAACWTHSLALVQQYSWNWLCWDNIVPYLKYINRNGAITLTGAYSRTAYTQTSWVAAEEGLTSYLGSHTRAAGYPGIANVGASSAPPDTFTQTIANDLDGVMDQSFIDGSAGPAQQDPYMATHVANAVWSEAHQKYWWAVPEMSTPTESENTYGLAAALMAMSGYSSYSTSIGPASACYASGCAESWYAEYDSALQLGPATGAYQTRTDSGGHTFYERDFANGVAIANWSSNSIASFTPTPGGSYTGSTCSASSNSCSTLTNASTVTLGADGGAILLKTG